MNELMYARWFLLNGYGRIFHSRNGKKYFNENYFVRNNANYFKLYLQDE